MDAHAQLPASPWVARFAPLVPSGEVLDLACGSGRHAHLFARLGHPVLALDRDPEALARLAAENGVCPHFENGDRPHFGALRTMCFDLERSTDAADWPFEPGRFAGIVVTNYLHRPLLPKIVQALRPDGILIYETFAAGNERFGKPSNPAFLLEEGELLRLPLRVIAYESGQSPLPKPAMVQRLCASGPAFGREKAILAAEWCQE
ncbi:class I SAM-dependent methyltransferase [Pseudoduganella sp. GCM10020061]|uniref:class I SAM-dependent methyltransferase n=1 Tax=Pseudoduganella sp. GCM10020061 TaxID=3317345 RepID=UPI00363108B1